MFLPIDPIVALLVFVCVAIYYVLKSIPSEQKDMSSEEFCEWYMKLCETNRKNNESKLDEIRYDKWLYEHRQEE